MNNFLFFLKNQFLGIYYFISWIFIVIDIFLLIVFIIYFKKALEFKPKFIFEKPKKVITLRREIFREQWFEILNFFENAPQEKLKLAVFAADNLINKILQEIGISGDDLGQKLLKLDESSLESINDLIEAHKFKTELEKKDVYFDKKEIEETLKKYEKFLKEIGIII